MAGNIALGSVLLGLTFAFLIYYRKVMDPADAVDQFPGAYRFLQNKWYFDELYSALLVRPSLVVAGWCRWFDANVIDGFLHGAAKVTLTVSFISGKNDRNIVDGLANLLADVCQGWAPGSEVRRPDTSAATCSFWSWRRWPVDLLTYLSAWATAWVSRYASCRHS